MDTSVLLFLSLLLDAILGEPRLLWDRVPHPAILMGRAVRWCDTQLNTGAQSQSQWGDHSYRPFARGAGRWVDAKLVRPTGRNRSCRYPAGAAIAC